MSKLILIPSTGMILNADLVRKLVPSFSITKKRNFRVVESDTGTEPPKSQIVTEYSLSSQWTLHYMDFDAEGNEVVEQLPIDGTSDMFIGEIAEDMVSFVVDLMASDKVSKKPKYDEHDRWISWAPKRAARIQATWTASRDAGVATPDADPDMVTTVSVTDEMDSLIAATATTLGEGTEKTEGIGILGSKTAPFSMDQFPQLAEQGLSVPKGVMDDLLNIPFHEIA